VKENEALNQTSVKKEADAVDELHPLLLKLE